MEVVCSTTEAGREYHLYKEKQEIGRGLVAACKDGWKLCCAVEPAWRRRGYGRFLLKRMLADSGGYEKKGQSLHRVCVPMPEGQENFWRKFGFAPVPDSDDWVRCRKADLTAVEFTHQQLSAWLKPGGFYIDATCGNGGDTEFLCRLAGPKGRVLAIDLQQQAVENTNRRLAEQGLSEIGRAVQADHARLAELAEPESADCVLFNFGYLPGTAHEVFTTPKTSLPAVKAALNLLRPGGVLAACLYSGGVNGSNEKQTMQVFLASLPLSRYTVLECRFANWAETAPLPCFVLRRG